MRNAQSPAVRESRFVSPVRGALILLLLLLVCGGGWPDARAAVGAEAATATPLTGDEQSTAAQHRTLGKQLYRQGDFHASKQAFQGERHFLVATHDHDQHPSLEHQYNRPVALSFLRPLSCR